MGRLMERLMEHLMGVPMLKKDIVESMHRVGTHVDSDGRWLAFWALDSLLMK